ncbi:hypothetical protein Hanom_Chr17g01583851 [Helianthus anomalus]
MTSKTGESSSSAQGSSNALYIKWGLASFNNLVQDYDIRAKWNPVLPLKTDTTFPLKEVSCLRDIPTSSKDKDWKKKFFFIDASVIPGEMQWREMGPKDKVKDDGPPKYAYVENTLFKRLSQCPSECTVIPGGALVMAGMSLLWRDISLYSSFQRDDGGKWSLFDFVNPPRNAAVSVADRVIGEKEPDVLKIHLEQFLLPAVPADPSTYICQPPPSGGSAVSAAEVKKSIRVKVTGRKYMAAGAAAFAIAVGVFVSVGGVAVTSAAAELVSPTRALKKRKVIPPLTAFQAIQTAYAMPTGFTVEVQVEGVSSVPLTSVDVMHSATSGPSLSELISQVSASALISSLLPPLVFTVAVVVTTSLVSTPLSSNVIPTSLFDSPIGVFSASEKEMPVASVAHVPTSARNTAVSDAGGSSSGIVDDGTHLGDDLYLPTINWDPNVQDKRYQPKWKTTESSRLIFPPVVHHWVERAYPPAKSSYVEGLNNKNLMNATMVDSVSQPRRLVEIRCRWMHDNNELHQAQAAIQELKDEKYRLETQLQAAGLREIGFFSEKNKAEDGLKCVTAHLAEERILWARDIAEKDRVLAHAKTVQEELERKAVVDAQKVRSQLSAKTEKFRVDIDFMSQVQERYHGRGGGAGGITYELQQQCDSLVSEKNKLVESSTNHQAHLKEAESALEQSNAEVDSLTSQLAGLRGDRNWLITNDLVGAFEYLRQSESFTALLHRLSVAAYQSGRHDGVYHGYFECQHLDTITPAFHTKRGKLQGDMADDLEVAYNDPLPAYADLTDKVTEDGVDSLRLMLDPAEESEEE